MGGFLIGGEPDPFKSSNTKIIPQALVQIITLKFYWNQASITPKTSRIPNHQSLLDSNPKFMKNFYLQAFDHEDHSYTHE
jgi:hypothetical protein